MTEINHFNVRVYGLFINDKNEVLLSYECINNFSMIKFPGGGLHFGEGTEDCIKRELMEELGQKIEIVQHFYTTGFFQCSAFNPEHQLLSIYYIVRPKDNNLYKISDSFHEMKNASQSFRWKKIDINLSPELTFPVDKHVAVLLCDR